MKNPQLAVRCSGFSLSRALIRKSKIKLMILSQIIIFRATLCPFQHASRQFHHPYYLKMSKIPVTPQTPNRHACPSVVQPETSIWPLWSNASVFIQHRLCCIYRTLHCLKFSAFARPIYTYTLPLFWHSISLVSWKTLLDVGTSSSKEAVLAAFCIRRRLPVITLYISFFSGQCDRFHISVITLDVFVDYFLSN